MSSASKPSNGLHQRKVPASPTTTNGNHSHSHSHSILHSHSHSHDGGHYDEASMLFKALKGEGDRGSFITLVGLFCNIALTLLKGLAGWYLNSASLIADAGHSLSDLLGDFVTLFAWRLSQRPPSETYPYGYGKFESVGTTAVSLLLFAGGMGIGLHSYSLLLEALSPIVSHLSPGPLRSLLSILLSFSPSSDGHSHGGGDGDLDANAAWFPLLGIIVKEYLYRVTKKVADEEGSSVLLANALHHRSDAFASVVTVIAILGSVALPSLPLDPLGGLVVAAMILIQGTSLFGGAIAELTDAGVPAETRESLLDVSHAVEPISSTKAHKIHSVRAVKSGALMFVDLVIEFPAKMGLGEALQTTERIRAAIKEQRKEVKEVRFRIVEPHSKDDGDWK